MGDGAKKNNFFYFLFIWWLIQRIFVDFPFNNFAVYFSLNIDD